MKKEFIQTIKVLVLAIVVGAGSMFVSAQSSGTPVPPPAGCTGPSVCNTPPPINVGSTAQVKDGGLSVAYNSGSFFSWKNSYLLGNTYVGLAATGGTPAINSTLRVNGDTYVNPLSNGNNERVCADASGKLVLCAAPPVTTTNTQIYTIVNGVQTTSGPLGTGSPNSFTPPVGATNIYVKVWGAGGGGSNFSAPVKPILDCIGGSLGGNSCTVLSGSQLPNMGPNGVPEGYQNGTTFASGMGGGGGAYKQFPFTGTGAQTIIVGAGGLGGKRVDAQTRGPILQIGLDILGNAGQAGGSTTFGTTTVAGGGGGTTQRFRHLSNSPSSGFSVYKDYLAVTPAGAPPLPNGAAGGVNQSPGATGTLGTFVPISPGATSCFITGPAGIGGYGGSGNTYGKGGNGGYSAVDDTLLEQASKQKTNIFSFAKLFTKVAQAQSGCQGQLPYVVGQDGAPGRVEITWDQTN